MTKILDETGLEEYSSKIKEYMPFAENITSEMPIFTAKDISPKVENARVDWTARDPSRNITGQGWFNAKKIMLTDSICLLCASVSVPAKLKINANSDIQLGLNWSTALEEVYGGSLNYSVAGEARSRSDHTNIYNTSVDGYLWCIRACNGENAVINFIVLGKSKSS